jgi:uncharacterized protein involved in exopolysaccharide biosynthesis
MKPSLELAKKEGPVEVLDPPIQPPQSYNYGVDPNADNEVHLLDYWRAIRKRLWLVFGIVALVTMLAVVYVARKPDFFEAQARVQVDLEDTGGIVNNARTFYGPSDDPIYFNTQLQILVSPGLMRRVVRTLDLEHNPDFFKGEPAQRQSTWQTMQRMVGLGKQEQVAGAKAQDQLPLTTTVAEATAREDLNEARRLAPYVNTVLGGLKVEPVKETRGYYKETRLIDIKFTHTVPDVTSKVVNAIAETYVFSNLEKRTEANSTTGDFLQKRIALRNGSSITRRTIRSSRSIRIRTQSSSDSLDSTSNCSKLKTIAKRRKLLTTPPKCRPRPTRWSTPNRNKQARSSRSWLNSGRSGRNCSSTPRKKRRK